MVSGTYLLLADALTGGRGPVSAALPVRTKSAVGRGVLAG